MRRLQWAVHACAGGGAQQPPGKLAGSVGQRLFRLKEKTGYIASFISGMIKDSFHLTSLAN